ncbi:uncharacterized protein BKA55DRAFT_309525 [Fusarium redolens]|uniref:Nephrocystin 3-like N-terminal domain-containing protein n=1 Tax=Fusarium redolens TaxID=48865 RepID=A0A9P9FVS4_FUSRE|nr:uncharacterized protein BKA55DRAFT_309525 [Fusarium redolens]KAH7200979.1 hypothetical protein BKA55DRAFT_309525 [Fusarium redolens]
MDPASAIGATSAVLSFVDFICKVTKTGYELYDASNGTLDDYERLKTVTSALDPSLQSLKDGVATKGGASLSGAERGMLDVAERCKEIGVGLISLINTYPVGEKTAENSSIDTSNAKLSNRLRRIGKTSKAAIHVVWTRSEARALRDEFTACITQLSIHLAVISRSDILAKLEDLIQAGNSRDGEALDLRDIVSPLGEDLNDLRNQVFTSAAELRYMIDNLQRQSNDDRDAWVESIEHIRTFYQVSQGTLQAMNHQCILDGISFPGMNTKRAILDEAPASKGTYEWMLYDESIPESHTHTLDLSFKLWLLQGHGIFHITGKPGSGKSTLMNLIAHHKEAKTLLNSWADGDGKKLIKAIVCLSKPGQSLEKSMEGLQRTLLYSILDQARQSLIPQALPQFWNPENWPSLKLRSDKKKRISKEDIEAALEAVLTNSSSNYRFCIFLDGADEFEDITFPKWKLAMRLLSWAGGNVKICVSSREEDPWLTRFPSGQRMRLHAVTRDDIRKAIENDILEHPDFQSFPQEDQLGFIQEFIDEANGVFIWVKLVLKYVTEKLDHSEDLPQLYRTLSTLPKSLEAFYEKILNDFPEPDRKEAYTILYILLRTKPPHRTFLFSFIRQCIGHNRSLSTADRRDCGDPIWLGEHVEAFERRLPLLLKGMVTSIKNTKRMGQRRILPVHYYRLEVSHRSVYEFLQLRVNKITDSAADQKLTMIQGLTQTWKASGPFVPSLFNYDILEMLLTWLRDNFKDGDTFVFQQLSELDSWLFQSQHTGNWNTFRQFDRGQRTPATVSVLETAARIGWLQYLRWELTNTDHPWMHLDSIRASLLRAASTKREGDDVSCQEYLLQLDFSPNSKGYLPPWDDIPLSTWQGLICQAWIYGTMFEKEKYHWPRIAKYLEYDAVTPVVFSWSLPDLPTHDRMLAVNQVVRGRDQPRVSISKCWIRFGPTHGTKEAVDLNITDMCIPPSLAREFPGGISLWQLYELYGPKDDPELSRQMQLAQGLRESRGGTRFGVSITVWGCCVFLLLAMVLNLFLQ